MRIKHALAATGAVISIGALASAAPAGAATSADTTVATEPTAISFDAPTASYGTLDCVVSTAHGSSCNPADFDRLTRGQTLSASLFTGTYRTGSRLRVYITAYEAGYACTSDSTDIDARILFPSYSRFYKNVESVWTWNHCDVQIMGSTYPDKSPHSTWIDRSDNLAAVGDGWANADSWIRLS